MSLPQKIALTIIASALLGGGWVLASNAKESRLKVEAEIARKMAEERAERERAEVAFSNGIRESSMSELRTLAKGCVVAITAEIDADSDGIFDWFFTEIKVDVLRSIENMGMRGVPMSAWESQISSDALLSKGADQLQAPRYGQPPSMDVVVHELRNGFSGQSPWLRRYTCTLSEGRPPIVTSGSPISLN